MNDRSLWTSVYFVNNSLFVNQQSISLGFSWCGICQTDLKIVFVANGSLDLVLFTVDLAWIPTDSATLLVLLIWFCGDNLFEIILTEKLIMQN